VAATQGNKAQQSGKAHQGKKVIASNRRARHDYTIEDVVEAGIMLTGTEVKSLRAGRATLTEGYAMITEGEAWLHGVHIPEYTQGTWTNHEPRRVRKLLLHRKEIDRLARVTSEVAVGVRLADLGEHSHSPQRGGRDPPAHITDHGGFAVSDYRSARATGSGRGRGLRYSCRRVAGPP
jgi:tmRNA-binding protein